MKEAEFGNQNIKDLHGKLKEINLKTYVGNKLIKALLAKNRDIVSNAAYSVDNSAQLSDDDEPYVMRKLSEIHTPKEVYY